MKISAFIPVTNAIKRGDTFIEAINSHLYWADEIIIVDGGSTDGTVEAIHNLKNPKIKIFLRKWPQDKWSWTEFAKSWNIGLRMATGDWVAAGESDHIFHQNEANRIREEVERETRRGKAVMRVQKLQSARYDYWQSKSQMYYFIYRAKFPQIIYGFDPVHRTDLAHPIWWDGRSVYEDVPTGTAILEGTQYEGLIGGTGANLYNYLWTFKTIDQVIAERMKANAAWNRFSGFTDIYKHVKNEDKYLVTKEVVGQILSIRQKATRYIPLDSQPELMHEKIRTQLKPDMIGHPDWSNPYEITA